MFKNYFTIAWRNLIRNRAFSIINILGLAVGMSSAILILLWVQYVAGIDQFHSRLDRLYEVFSNDKVDGTIRTLNSTPEIMTPELVRDYPEIERASRMNLGSRNLLSPDSTTPGILSNGNVVDPDFLMMFDLPFVAGDPKSALNDPLAMVITSSSNSPPPSFS
jgi:putative ABC transport system permease protein